MQTCWADSQKTNRAPSHSNYSLTVCWKAYSCKQQQKNIHTSDKLWGQSIVFSAQRTSNARGISKSYHHNVSVFWVKWTVLWWQYTVLDHEIMVNMVWFVTFILEPVQQWYYPLVHYGFDVAMLLALPFADAAVTWNIEWWWIHKKYREDWTGVVNCLCTKMKLILVFISHIVQQWGKYNPCTYVWFQFITFWQYTHMFKWNKWPKQLIKICWHFKLTGWELKVGYKCYQPHNVAQDLVKGCTYPDNHSTG